MVSSFIFFILRLQIEKETLRDKTSCYLAVAAAMEF